MHDENHLSPNSTDTSRTLTGGGEYRISPRNFLGIPLPFTKGRAGPLKLYLLPETFSLRFDMTTRRSIQYDRQLDNTLISRLGSLYSKDALYTLSGAWKPLDPLGYSFSSTRNANIPGVEPLRVGGINFGRQTAFTHRFDARWPFRFGPWLSPDIDGSTSFNEARGPELSPNLAVGNFSNSSGGNFRYTLPLTRLLGKKPGAKPDTTRGGFGLPIAGMLSHIGDLQARASFNRNTSFSRLTGYPSMAYRLGLDPEPGFEGKNGGEPNVFREPQASDNTSLSQLGELSTQVSLWTGASARLLANYTYNRRSSNSQTYENSSASWPDLSGDWGQVNKVLHLGKIFPTLSAQTRYSRRVDTEGLYGRPYSAITSSSNWQPLLSFNGTTSSGIQTVLAAEYSSSLRKDYRNSTSFDGDLSGSADTRQSNLTVRSTLSKTLNPGTKFKFLGLFGSNLRSTLTMAFRGSYNRRKGGTTIPGQTRVGAETDNDRIDAALSGTYSFSRSVSGTLGLGFNQYRDFTRAVFSSGGGDGGHLAQRSVRIEANAQMSF